MRRIQTLGFLILLSMVSVLPVAADDAVQVHFTGVCDFVSEGNKVLVILPKAASGLPALGIPPHQAFVRVDRGRPLISGPARRSVVNGKSIVYLDGETISFGPTPGPSILRQERSFTDHVFPIGEPISSRFLSGDPRDVAAQLLIETGTLRGEAINRQTFYLAAAGKSPAATAKPLNPAHDVVLELPAAADGPGQPFVVRIGGTTMTFEHRDGVRLTIGNLPSESPSMAMGQDTHFLLHYLLTGRPIRPESDVIPTRYGFVLTGPRDDCYPALWRLFFR